MQLKQNLASFRIITFFCVKLVPSWMGHIAGMQGLAIAYFHIIPPTQWFKSSGQN
jgi:hypothetical protein